MEISTLETAGLLILWLVWAVLLIGGFLMGSPTAENPQRIPRWKRMGASMALVGAGVWFWIVGAGSDYSTLALYVAGGMAFGFIGDLFMARLILRDDRYVFGGIGSFGIGHVLYIVGLMSYSTAQGYNARWGALLVFLILGGILWYLVVYRPAPEPSTLHSAALPYALLLASTAGIAAGIALQTSAFFPVAVGAVLFLLSDLLLAAQLFNGLHFTGIGDAVWLLYSPGQMLIVYGAIFAAINHP